MRFVSYHTIAYMLAVFALTGCEGTVYALKNAEASASRGIANFSDRVNPQPQQLRRPAEPRYCYMTANDTVCYRDPLSNAETRLVGYQEPLVPVGQAATVNTRTRNIRDETPVAEVGSTPPAYAMPPVQRPDTVNVPPPPPISENRNDVEPLRL